MAHRPNSFLDLVRLWGTLGTAVVFSSGIAAQTTHVEFRDREGHVFSEAEQAVIVRIANTAVAEVREVLPEVPRSVTLVVSSGEGVIPETGELGMAPEPGRVTWTVDASRSEGVIAIARARLRSTLFHELHHLARGYVVRGGAPRTSFMDAVVSEGMATAFERDFAGARPPWAEYPADVSAWVEELLALPMSAFASYSKWMLEHPDGRRWIGYRAGTYIVDQAMSTSGLSSADLVLTPTARVLALSSRRQAPVDDR